ncbi:hypothetical protein GCM10009000_003530 [Halobacterium noricense]
MVESTEENDTEVLDTDSDVTSISESTPESRTSDHTPTAKPSDSTDFGEIYVNSNGVLEERPQNEGYFRLSQYHRAEDGVTGTTKTTYFGPERESTSKITVTDSKYRMIQQSTTNYTHQDPRTTEIVLFSVFSDGEYVGKQTDPNGETIYRENRFNRHTASFIGYTDGVISDIEWTLQQHTNVDGIDAAEFTATAAPGIDGAATTTGSLYIDDTFRVLGYDVLVENEDGERLLEASFEFVTRDPDPLTTPDWYENKPE